MASIYSCFILFHFTTMLPLHCSDEKITLHFYFVVLLLFIDKIENATKEGFLHQRRFSLLPEQRGREIVGGFL